MLAARRRCELLLGAWSKLPCCAVQAWVRKRVAQGGLPRPSAVHILSSTKRWGVRELLSDVQVRLAAVWVAWVGGWVCCHEVGWRCQAGWTRPLAHEAACQLGFGCTEWCR